MEQSLGLKKFGKTADQVAGEQKLGQKQKNIEK
jgi:hypothetical protein